jgi:peptide/nickel transport system substrate-binding protein
MQQVGPQAYATKPVGTGAFKFVEWRKDDRVVLEANPDYFFGKPGIDELVIRAIQEPSTRVAELFRGGMDLVVSVPTQYWECVRGNQNLRLNRFLTTQNRSRMCPTSEGIEAISRRSMFLGVHAGAAHVLLQGR